MRITAALLLMLTFSLDAEAGRRCQTCHRDKHGRIQRSAEVKRQFRKTHPCPGTGRTSGPCRGYVIDHTIALGCGGADAPGNMAWQTTAEAKAKDKWELKCK